MSGVMHVCNNVCPLSKLAAIFLDKMHCFGSDSYHAVTLKPKARSGIQGLGPALNLNTTLSTKDDVYGTCWQCFLLSPPLVVMELDYADFS